VDGDDRDDRDERARAQQIAELSHKRRLAERLAKRGLAIAVSGPFAAVVCAIVGSTCHAPLVATLGLFYAWTAIVAGGVYSAGNEMARRSAVRQLRALDEHRRLPEARVVIR